MEKENYNIVKERVSTGFINQKGNVDFHDNYKFYILKNDEEKVLSQQFYCIVDLGLDHFAVATLKDNADFNNYNYFDLSFEQDKVIDAKIKWAIMRINRDFDGKIIPGGESLITSYLYDKISSNNSATATVYCNGKLTYVDIDINSQYYGKQIIPCILNYAVPFDTEYLGLAECGIDNIIGYIPRTTIPKEEFAKWNLLTKNQAKIVSDFIKNDLLVDIDEETAKKYKFLTGVDLEKTNDKVLRKSNNSNKF